MDIRPFDYLCSRTKDNIDDLMRKKRSHELDIKHLELISQKYRLLLEFDKMVIEYVETIEPSAANRLLYIARCKRLYTSINDIEKLITPIKELCALHRWYPNGCEPESDSGSDYDTAPDDDD